MKKRILKALVLGGVLSMCLGLSGCYIPPDDLSGEVNNLGVGSNNLPYQTVSVTEVPTPTPSPTIDMSVGAFNPSETTTAPNSMPNVDWDDGIADPITGGNTTNNTQSGSGVTGQQIGVTTTRPSIGVTTANPNATKAPTNTPAPSSLKKGSSGDAVKSLQKRLKELGYYTGSVDGDFGENTEKAVKAFQERNGLTVDGKAGNNTMKKLNSSSAVKAATATATPKKTNKPTPAPTARRTAAPTAKPTATPNLTKDIYLRDGSSGKDVKRLQERLISLGWLAGSADSNYGGSTEAAVIAFQKKTSGLYDDGVAGPSTLQALYSSNAAKSSTPVAVVGVKLQSGNEGDAVRALQKRLKALGYLTGSVDGSYGEKTKAAVIAFQSNNGLKVDGVAGSGTMNAIFSQYALKAGQSASSGGSGTGPASGDYSTLRPGDEGSAITDMQRRLHELGYYDGKINGIYSSLTSDAVRAFQSNNGLKVDGVAGKDTLKKMFSSSAKSASSSSDKTYEKLKRGDSGNAVVEVQEVLQSLGYLSEITGIYDDATYYAVMSFQLNNGLSADGIAGNDTQTKLFSGNAKSAY